MIPCRVVFCTELRARNAGVASATGSSQQDEDESDGDHEASKMICILNPTYKPKAHETLDFGTYTQDFDIMGGFPFVIVHDAVVYLQKPGVCSSIIPPPFLPIKILALIRF